MHDSGHQSIFDLFGSASKLGYCTNVHPGVRLSEVQNQLRAHARDVQRIVGRDRDLPIGLWLSNTAAIQLMGDPGAFDAFRDLLRELRLEPFSFNAFPWGDFHGSSVKRRVYLPDWAQYERLEYTIAIAAIAADLAPEGSEISISTLPLGWRGLASPQETIDEHAAANSLRALARHLSRMEADTGRCIHIDIEPEPGCFLDTAAGTVRFFSEHLLRRGSESEVMLRHLRICHDVCHSAVMFEPQLDALQTYADAGIRVGKVQISAALEVRPGPDRPASALLSPFAEERYLHQTVIRLPDGRTQRFDDLPDALAAADSQPGACWRIHYHVPLGMSPQAESGIRTTAEEIAPAVAAARRLHDTRHFEIETYTWNVLPAALRPNTLADGIASEFAALRTLVPGPRP